jgi:RNA polymerase sigma factor (TIGR02999 family)
VNANARDLGTVTRALNGLTPAEGEVVYARIYEELRRIAAAHLRLAPANGTVNATTLVHEAWLKLQGASWERRAHFFGAAARAMRQVLVDEARERQAAKRGGGKRPLTLHSVIDEGGLDTVDLLALEEALTQLERRDERAARVVELRFFAGLTIAETAEVLQLTARTVTRDWQFAQSWLYRRLNDE